MAVVQTSGHSSSVKWFITTLLTSIWVNERATEATSLKTFKALEEKALCILSFSVSLTDFCRACLTKRRRERRSSFKKSPNFGGKWKIG